MSPNILAIESSCDETSASVISNGKVLNNIIASQSIHQKYGGVVPELASREHQKNIIDVVNQSLKQSRLKPTDLHAIAFTRGPGLMGALMVGVSFAKGMAIALNIPLIDVNHMHAHIMAHFIVKPGEEKAVPKFPFLCLTVSGGHTQLIIVNDFLDFKILGQTKDDAIGEAFDKGAKMLGLPYPGGPLIDKYAKTGDKSRFEFPITSLEGYDFSFSGIKTALLYFLRDNQQQQADFVNQNMNDICASYQSSLIEMLMIKVRKAVKEFRINDIAIAGGVAANSALRNVLTEYGNKFNKQIFIPEFQYCTDNAAMIAITAHYKFVRNEFTTLDVAPVASFHDL